MKRAQLGSEQFELVPIFRNSGRARPELRNCFFGGSYSRGTADAEPLPTIRKPLTGFFEAKCGVKNRVRSGVTAKASIGINVRIVFHEK